MRSSHFIMNTCLCCDNDIRRSCEDVVRTSIMNMVASEQIKKIENQYQKYVSGELKCTPREGATIINNYNSRRKIGSLL